MTEQFKGLQNVADSRLGSKVIFATDEFFAAANRMLQPSEPQFIEDKFDEHGKWMDGWETRRRRDGGNDHCYVRLGKPSTIEGFNVDTSHFTGNYAPAVAIEGIFSELSDEDFVKQADGLDWQPLLAVSELQGDGENFFAVQGENGQQTISHLRVNIYPDGGVARLRAFGRIQFTDDVYQLSDINVASMSYGARAIHANDEHYGTLQNILADHEPINMADGWETRRRREPGNDWGVIALPKAANVSKIIIDTTLFKGNFPDSCSIQAAYLGHSEEGLLITQSMFWQVLLTPQKLSMNAQHTFTEFEFSSPITHIRLNIFPDGGIMRLKMLGQFVS